MTSPIREVIMLFYRFTGNKPLKTKEGTTMMNRMKEEEFVKMPLHLQIVCLLELWGKNDDRVSSEADHVIA